MMRFEGEGLLDSHAYLSQNDFDGGFDVSLSFECMRYMGNKKPVQIVAFETTVNTDSPEEAMRLVQWTPKRVRVIIEEID
jgi:hypothetical protein